MQVLVNAGYNKPSRRSGLRCKFMSQTEVAKNEIHGKAGVYVDATQ